MAAKISTIVMKVDLDCKSCNKKIRKTIISLQEKEKIETVVYDEKNNTVTVSGPFDPKRVCKKLCCRACKVIKDIRIKEDKPKEEPKKEEPKKEEPKKAEPKKEEPKKEEPKKEAPKKEEPKKEEPKKEEPKKEAPKKEEPKKEEPKPVKEEPVHGCQPCWPAGPVCSCGCKPWYGGYYGNNRCPWCGRGFDCEVMAPPQVVIQPPVYVYGAPQGCYGQKNCEFFYEEEPQAACSVM